MNKGMIWANILKIRQSLGSDEIHVWQATLSRLTPAAEELKSLLSGDEVARSACFYFMEHRRSFIAGRSLLRMILAAYCGGSPRSLCFRYGTGQKPSIQSTPDLVRIVSFNLSHSGNAIQVAIAAEGALGIDIEYCGNRPISNALCAECLTSEEATDVMCRDEQEQQSAFLRYWVHKEACLKNMGCGLVVPPSDVYVEFQDPGHSIIHYSNLTKRASMFGTDLPCPPGYRAALATAGYGRTLRSFVL